MRTEETPRPESKNFIAAISNSACDAVLPKFADPELILEKAHALSTERQSLLGPYFEAERDGKNAKADPLPKDH